ncbi:MAG: thioredoxin [Draconibacterium sp.]|nr:thioredoxin [Draconibacterium sp.]
MKTRNLFLIAIGIALLASCSSTGSKSESSASAEKPEVSKVDNHNAESKVVYLTDETFKQKVFNYTENEEWKYEGTVPCIVDFYADWCGPCKRIAPTLDELSKEYDGKVIIYKVDTEKQREVASAFGIRSIPSILFVPLEGQPQMAQGALPKESFVSAINEVLLGQSSNVPTGQGGS